MPEKNDIESKAGPAERYVCSWLLLSTFCIPGKTDNDPKAAPNPCTRCTRLTAKAHLSNPLNHSSDSHQESACTDVPLFFML